MTQRIFDVDNPQDVKDLFNLVPEEVQKIEVRPNDAVAFLNKYDLVIELSRLFCIAWRDKTEITRPVDESQWIGKLCWFWGTDMTKDKEIGILQKIEKYSNNQKLYRSSESGLWGNCRPVRRDEVQFVDDADYKGVVNARYSNVLK